MTSTRLMFRDTPSYIPHYSPNLKTLSGYNTPPSTTSPSSTMSSISSSTDPGVLTSSQFGETLLFMRRIGEILRKDPQEAAKQLNDWLLDSKSPRFWRSMIYSLSGCAREQLGQLSYARENYSEGLRAFERLEKKLGSEQVERLRPNAEFMRYRLRFLGGRIDYLVVDQDRW